jgi:hypothetical protein
MTKPKSKPQQKPKTKPKQYDPKGVKKKKRMANASNVYGSKAANRDSDFE